MSVKNDCECDASVHCIIKTQMSCVRISATAVQTYAKDNSYIASELRERVLTQCSVEDTHALNAPVNKI